MHAIEIRVEGRIDPSWSEWFEGFEVVQGKGQLTILRGPLIDQAALYGLLAKLRDLGLPLISVERIQHPD